MELFTSFVTKLINSGDPEPKLIVFDRPFFRSKYGVCPYPKLYFFPPLMTLRWLRIFFAGGKFILITSCLPLIYAPPTARYFSIRSSNGNGKDPSEFTWTLGTYPYHLLNIPPSSLARWNINFLELLSSDILMTAFSYKTWFENEKVWQRQKRNWNRKLK